MTPPKPRRIDIPFEIELQNGMKAIVDADDYSRLQGYPWRAYKNYDTWYVSRSEKGKLISMHRQILNAKKGTQIDHINRNGLDNRKCNLRFCTHSQNRANTPPVSKTGFKGVTRVTKKFKTTLHVSYHVAIRKNKKKINIGWFRDPIEAAKAYDKAAIKLHGEFAYLNFPESK